MRTMTIAALVAVSCSCTEAEAQEYIESEVENLQDLADAGDLRYSDMRVACENLGIEYDYIEYFTERLANYVPKAKEVDDDEEVDDEFADFGESAFGMNRVTLEMLCAI